MRLFEHADYKFIEQRRKAYAISGFLLIVGFLVMLGWQIARGSWVHYGVDFTGGTLVQVHFEQPTTVGDVRAALAGVQAEITRFEGQDDFLIRFAEFAGEGTGTTDVITRQLAASYGDDGFQLVRTEAVSPTIGAELQERALLAIILSFALTLIYLAFRFEWRFGVAAIIATLHDTVTTLAFISALQLEVSLPTIAAVLTIIGYSLNDTIVVFDRIRENLKKSGRRASYIELVNRAINETLPRTILTSGTTLVVLLALAIFGGAIIRDFAVILIVGVLVGTYSTIFIASPALLEIEQRFGRREGKPRTAEA